LKVLINQLALLVAHAALAVRHQCVTCIVVFADVAVDAFPSLFAFARFVSASRCSVRSVWQGSAKGCGAVLSSEARRTVALSIRFTTLGKLLTLEILEVAVEAGRTAVGTVTVYGEEVIGRLVRGVVAVCPVRRPRLQCEDRSQDGEDIGGRLSHRGTTVLESRWPSGQMAIAVGRFSGGVCRVRPLGDNDDIRLLDDGTWTTGKLTQAREMRHSREDRMEAPER
jgi:hypothetical protein